MHSQEAEAGATPQSGPGGSAQRVRSRSVGETRILERVQGRILSARGQRVIRDADLASLYGVPTERLNEQVKRNADRFPPGFAFRLTPEEAAGLAAICGQSTTRKHTSQPPWVFTEHGVIAAAFVLN